MKARPFSGLGWKAWGGGTPTSGAGRRKDLDGLGSGWYADEATLLGYLIRVVPSSLFTSRHLQLAERF